MKSGYLFKLPLCLPHNTALSSNSEVSLSEMEPTHFPKFRLGCPGEIFSINSISERILQATSGDDPIIDIFNFEGQKLLSWRISDILLPKFKAFTNVQICADPDILAASTKDEDDNTHTSLLSITQRRKVINWDIPTEWRRLHPNDALVFWCEKGSSISSGLKMKVRGHSPFQELTTRMKPEPTIYGIGMVNYKTKENVVIPIRKIEETLSDDASETTQFWLTNMIILPGGGNGRLLLTLERSLSEAESCSCT